MAEPDEPFVWIRGMGDPNARLMRIYFGKSSDDPIPFILTVTPEYVAHKIQKTLPLSIQDFQNYCNDHRVELRKIALGCKQRGFNSETLTSFDISRIS